MSGLPITHRSVMQEISEACEPLLHCLEVHAANIEAWQHDFSCENWAQFAFEHWEARSREQESEIRAELAVPQHLLW